MRKLLLSLLLLPAWLFAGGMGIYLTGSSNEAKVTQNYIFDINVSRTWKENLSGIGIVFDSNLGRDRLFAYRFNLEYLGGYVDSIDGDTNVDIELHRVNMLHTFGFGLVRTPKLRVWAGPRISMSYQTVYDNGYKTNGAGRGNDGYEFGLGLAPVMGVNFNFTPQFALSFDADYRFGWATGEWYDNAFTRNSYHMERRESAFGARLYFIMRFNERFN